MNRMNGATGAGAPNGGMMPNRNAQGRGGNGDTAVAANGNTGHWNIVQDNNSIRVTIPEHMAADAGIFGSTVIINKHGAPPVAAAGAVAAPPVLANRNNATGATVHGQLDGTTGAARVANRPTHGDERGRRGGSRAIAPVAAAGNAVANPPLAQMDGMHDDEGKLVVECGHGSIKSLTPGNVAYREAIQVNCGAFYAACVDNDKAKKTAIIADFLNRYQFNFQPPKGEANYRAAAKEKVRVALSKAGKNRTGAQDSDSDVIVLSESDDEDAKPQAKKVARGDARGRV
jgi:hypothetical protein